MTLAEALKQVYVPYPPRGEINVGDQIVMKRGAGPKAEAAWCYVTIESQEDVNLLDDAMKGPRP